jgi:protein transport protein SEC61 subunit gamma-like protein
MGFLEDSIRVLKLTRKPKKEEYIMIAKVTGAGIILIGLLGAVLQLIGIWLGMVE